MYIHVILYVNTNQAFCWLFSCGYSNYLDQVAEEINDTLQESGQVVISELSKTFTLSTDFLLEVIHLISMHTLHDSKCFETRSLSWLPCVIV